MAPEKRKDSRYHRIIEHVFFRHYSTGQTSFEFERPEIADAARALGIAELANPGDLVNRYRFRIPLPDSILATAPTGMTWVIRLISRGRYEFALDRSTIIRAAERMSETRIPDATPSIIAHYRLSDEQALLAILRYNRLIDIFLGVTCYSLQNHLRTTVTTIRHIESGVRRGTTQIEVDELYVGVDQRGAHYVIPVQAKGGADLLSIVQIEQDMLMCDQKFPGLVARPVGAQFLADSVIALFEFEQSQGGVAVVRERHYRLVHADTLTPDEIARYRTRVER